MPSGAYIRSEATKQKMSDSKKGKNNPMWGQQVSEKTKKKISDAEKGQKHYNWKGDEVGYYGLHIWISKQFGKANHCEECGLDKIPEGKKRYFHWANISGEYKRDLTDWKQMCIKCHCKFDKNWLKRRRDNLGRFI